MRITILTSEMVRTYRENFDNLMSKLSIATISKKETGYLPSDKREIVTYFDEKRRIIGESVWWCGGCSHFLRKHNNFMVRTTPIVGNIASNVRPLDRKAVTPNKGTLSPILRWANAVGNQWVESTVRSYRKTAK